TSELARNGSSGRRVSRSAVTSTGGTVASLCGSNGAELINGPEIDITSDEYLNPIAVGLGNGGRDVDRALQYIAQHACRAGGVVDHRPSAAARGLHRCLHGAIQGRDENRGAESIPE